MCGIAGLLQPHGESVDEAALQTMGCRQQHRGPDNFAVFVQQNFGCAHNRLSILDLSAAGNQPYCDERYVLVYNGEIYNYLDLRRKLEMDQGVIFQSTSDTAVLFQHLIHYGVPETLKAIKGMFAFSFYDNQEGLVYLCRDRYGIKPLYYTHCHTGFYWASEIKALTAVTEVKPDPIKTLYAAASISEHLNERSIFQNVQPVPPGTYVICLAGQAPSSPITYYDIFHDIDEAYYRELEGMSATAVLQTFQNLMESSIKSMLMSDAPMGAFVSGGIDSGLIALIAAQHDPDLSLFTAHVVGQYSEFPDAQRLSQSLNRQLHEARFMPDMMLTKWAEATYHHETPIVTHTNSIPFATVAQLAHDCGVKAVLTGEGADELFLGYPHLMARRYRQYLLAPVRWLQSLYGIVPGLKAYLFPGQKRSIDGFFNLLVQGFERQRLRERGYDVFSFLPAQQIPQQYLTIQMIREGLISLLHRNDRMGMLASIESRFPFLDEQMVRFAINLPVKWKTARSHRFHDFKHPFMVDKAIVRRAALQYLPESLVYKKKNGFPMYGHKHIRVQPGYFAGGYVEQLLGLPPGAEAHMIDQEPPYYIAKLVSVEIFGRLFAYGQSSADITEHLCRWVTLHTK